MVKKTTNNTIQFNTIFCLQKVVEVAISVLTSHFEKKEEKNRKEKRIDIHSYHTTRTIKRPTAYI